MKHFVLMLLVVGLWGLGTSDSNAQVVYSTYYQPVVVYRPAPVVYTSYYAPAPVVAAPVVQPVTRVRTRYRPFLGGTVTRVRAGYQTYYAPAPVVYAY